MSTDIVIEQKWAGDYPVSQLDRVPGDPASDVGYIDETKVFAAAWQAFKAGEGTPGMDFACHFVVFVRNVHYYNWLGCRDIVRKPAQETQHRNCSPWRVYGSDATP